VSHPITVLENQAALRAKAKAVADALQAKLDKVASEVSATKKAKDSAK